MKKIVYNSRMKKSLISILTFVLLFCFMFPSMSIAALEDVKFTANTATGSIQDIMHSMSTLTDKDKTIKDKVGTITQKQKDEFEEIVKNNIKDAIKDDFPDISKENLDKIYEDNKDASDKIKVTVAIPYTYASGTNRLDLRQTQVIIDRSKLTKDDIEKTLAKENIDEVDKDNYTDVRPGSSAAGQDPSTDVEDLNNVTENADKDSADIGGILLSPIFYLVNFVADAVTGSMGYLMTGGEGSLTGIGVLASSPSEMDLEKTDEYHVELGNVVGAVQYPNIVYTPEEIFSGEIDLLRIDFISGQDNEGKNITGDWANIRNVISSWYKVLRMIAIIGLLSVLIYTGIKIMISSSAQDKAKYKEWIINWFMAVAILFSMHYIMSFIISVTGEISNLLSYSCHRNKSYCR